MTISVDLEGYRDSMAVAYAFSQLKGSGELTDTIFADSTGRFVLERLTGKPLWFYFYIDSGDQFFYFRRILVKPGEDHQISCDITKEYMDASAISIKGPNSEGQLFYYSFDDGLRGSIGGKSIYSDLWTISNPGSLIDSLNQKIAKALVPFNKLLLNNKIDKVFFTISSDQIRYYYAFQLCTLVEIAVYDRTLADIKAQLETINRKVFEMHSVNDKGLMNSAVFHDYIDLYINFLIRSNQEEYNRNKFKGLGQTYELNLARRKLPKQVYKYHAIYSLWSKAVWKDRETLDLYEKYLDEFPQMTNNRYYQRLEKESIPIIRDLYGQTEKPMPAGAIVLDKDQKVNSWKELTSYFTGKPFFIDCWATWCGPCIAQFRYSGSLKEYLDDRNIGMAYIVFDDHLDMQKWESMIKKYGLTGHHLAANKEFQADFFRKINVDPSSGFGIPRYILTDENGEVLNSQMLSPGQGEELFDQIDHELN